MKKITLVSILLFNVWNVIAQNVRITSERQDYKEEIGIISTNKKVQIAFKIINQLEPTTMKELVELT